MVTHQRPIGSGYGKVSTASEVIGGTDLHGRLAIVTGGYSGIGLENTRAFSAAGATVVVPARRPDHAREQLAGIDRVEIAELDLADLDSVRSFADGFVASGRQIDLLVNNAAIMANPETRVAHGWESQFATNHLGHYALTNLLWPALAAAGSDAVRGFGPGARVISVSSRGHKASGIRWDDLQFESGYDKWQAYGQAKTANILFALRLDQLGERSGVRAFSVYPGGILTPLQRHLSVEEQQGRGWLNDDGTANPDFDWKTPEQGAATTAWAATSHQLDGLGGVYLEDCDIAVVADPETPEGQQHGVNAWAVDHAAAVRLWEISAQLTGIDAFGDPTEEGAE
jgi:NAD(P)-dependent dehydrogenase (short-subunit alcohol dehydrogenase family)